MLEVLPAALILLLFFLVLLGRNSKKKNRVGVIVLGDIGRSPRMRQHCLSLAREEFEVQYVAGAGSTIHPDLLANPHISICLVRPFPARLPRYLGILLKPVVQSAVLLVTGLTHFWGCSAVLMQNPPTIPVIGVVWLICKVYSCKMVIDWHNYGYTILALSLSDNHVLVRVARKIERVFGRAAAENFCVTSAMSGDLDQNWAIKAYTLHDRPSSTVHVDLKTKHNLLLRLGEKYPVFKGSTADSTPFTYVNQKNEVRAVENRPVLIISSTSWTADEDFSVLLSALQIYDSQYTPEYPAIICAITGTGPLKAYYEQQIEILQLQHVQIVTCWLEPADYPLLLGASDLGVSLHYSSSGLDLPMKVVDMFGAGIPVCARNFRCLSELVTHGKNGCVFEDAGKLAKQLLSLFNKFHAGNRGLQVLREGVKHFQSLPWHYHWRSVALPIFSEEYVLKDYGDEPTPYDINLYNLNTAEHY